MVLLLVVRVASAARQEPIPCGSCIALALTPAQGEAVLSQPATLAGLNVFILAGDDVPAAVRAAEALSARGARAGLVLASTLPAANLVLPASIEQAIVDMRGAPSVDAALGFAVRTLSTALRAAGANRIGLWLDPSRTREAAAPLAPYADFIVVRGNEAATGEAFAAMERWTAGEIDLGSAPDAVADAIAVDGMLRRAASDLAAGALLTLAPGSERAAPVVAGLAELVPAGLVPVTQLHLSCDAACSAEAFLDAATLDAVVSVRPHAAVREVRVPGSQRLIAILPALSSLLAPLDGPPPWRMTARGDELRFTVPVTGPFIVRISGWRRGNEGGFSTGVDVSGRRTLSVEEIVARHQAARARQAARVRTLISSGSTLLTFDAPGFSAPVTITADTVMYASGGGTDVAQHDIRVNGLRFSTRGDSVPQLPLIEPDRVVTPPLVIALTEDYRYRLEGLETIRSRRCYLVAFSPRSRERTLFAGRAWIDGDTFGLVRLDATQTALPGPVVSSRQVEDFEPRTGDGETLWLPVRTEINQVYETATFATPIRRVVIFTSHAVNAADFEARREAAYASDAVMMRDTPHGYRYLRRQRVRQPAATARTVVKDRQQHILTALGGVILDPNISVPLPFAGLSYVNFDLFERAAQLDVFFGGTYGRLAWASPPFRRSWRVSGDAFGIAVPYNDRAFVNGVEEYRQNISQQPFHASAGLVGPLPAGLRLRAFYEIDYTRYGRSDSTAAAFALPASAPVHGVRITVERQRGPLTLAAWWNRATRQRWNAWGLPPRLEAPIDTFDRYGVRALRTFAWTPGVVGRVEVAWMAGHDLDRFSRYAFGTFDNPLRGYPSASIRFDRGVVVRSAASWGAAAYLRIDAFADVGFVRDPGFGDATKGFPGIGAAAETRLPFGLLTAVEWGYGFAGRNRDSSRGTHVVRVSAYKVF